MPELPDLLYIVSHLRERLCGRHVTSERVHEPVLMRFAVRGNLSLLLGRTLEEILRKSHFVVFRFEGLDLAVNPMLAGRFALSAPTEPDDASLGFVLGFDDLDLRYLDDKKMGKAYLIVTEDWQAIPGMQTGGIDILSPEFTRERFVSLLKRRRQPGQRVRRRGAVRGGYPPEDILPLAVPRGRHPAARRHRQGDARGGRRGGAPSRADRGEGPRLPQGAKEGDLPALRREAADGRRQGHGRLVLPALPARDPAGSRRLDARRPLSR
jgi:hypothetical protein